MLNKNFGMKHRILIEKKDKNGNVVVVEDTKFISSSENRVIDFLLDLFTTDCDSLEFGNRNNKRGG